MLAFTTRKWNWNMQHCTAISVIAELLFRNINRQVTCSV